MKMYPYINRNLTWNKKIKKKKNPRKSTRVLITYIRRRAGKTVGPAIKNLKSTVKRTHRRLSLFTRKEQRGGGGPRYWRDVTASPLVLPVEYNNNWSGILKKIYIYK